MDEDCTGVMSAFRRDGKVYVSNGMFYVSTEDVKKAIELFQEYVDTFTDEEVKILNESVKEETNLAIAKTLQQEKKRKMNRGYVYLLECGGKHKIGFSKDVEQRMKQLDTRPFPLRCVCKVYSDIAYDVEQEIHKRIESYKQTGEWYNFGGEVQPGIFFNAVKRIEKELLEEQENKA